MSPINSILRAGKLTAGKDELIQRAAAGDREALSESLRKSEPLLRARLADKMPRRWKSVLDMDDVLQVTWLEAFRKIAEFKAHDDDSWNAWLWRIAHNNLIDAIRGLEGKSRLDPQKRLSPKGASEDDGTFLDQMFASLTTPSRIVRAKERAALMRKALDLMPRDYRRVIEFCDLEELPIETVETNLGRSAGAIYMLRARAREYLAELLRYQVELTG